MSGVFKERERRANHRSGWIAYVVRCLLGGGEDADPMDGFEDTSEAKKNRAAKKDLESWLALAAEGERKK